MQIQFIIHQTDEIVLSLLKNKQLQLKHIKEYNSQDLSKQCYISLL